MDLTTLRLLSSECGLRVLSVGKPTLLVEPSRRLADWQEQGFAADMAYMRRDPALLANPLALLPEAKSIISFALAYSRRALPALTPGYGRVARYAWGRDYHKVLRKRLERLVCRVEQHLQAPVLRRLGVDALPLLERAVAEGSGLGFVGKNSMLIRQGEGSFFFLAEILWDVVIEDVPTAGGGAGGCGSCSRCRTACPTGALVEEYRLDARRCISYLSIEKRGSLEEWEREALGEWIFGCDLCQEVCPFNHRALKEERPAEVPEFEAENGCGGLLFLPGVLGLRSAEAFLERFAGTPLMRAGREGLLRNAAVTAANTKSLVCIDVLDEAAGSDASAVVREHADWALRKLRLSENL